MVALLYGDEPAQTRIVWNNWSEVDMKRKLVEVWWSPQGKPIRSEMRNTRRVGRRSPR
jgi:hypothetical protein